MILSVTSVEFGYNGRLVLNDVSFAVRRGRMTALLGPNGVGKTTLLRCLNATLAPTAGCVLVEGTDVLRLSPRQIARRLGYLPQRAESGRMTALDAVLLGRKPHMGWLVTDRDLGLARDALAQVGLDHMAMRFTDRMSGGELQKVCLARALVQEPKVLLLDEPTSALDLRNQQDVLAIIKSVVRERDVASVMSMHDLNSALRFADTFLLIKDGRVFAHCERDEIRPDMIRSVYGVDVDIVRHGPHAVVIPIDN